MSASGSGPVVYDPYTLPSDDNVNPYAFSVELDGQWFLQKGKMIACAGQRRAQAGHPGLQFRGCSTATRPAASFP